MHTYLEILGQRKNIERFRNTQNNKIQGVKRSVSKFNALLIERWVEIGSTTQTWEGTTSKRVSIKSAIINVLFIISSA